MLAAVQQCVGYGLTPTPSMQFGYFIPWKNKSGQKEVAFKLSYMGILEIARRNGVTARANCVFKDDVFEWESGFEDRIVHKPNLFKRRDETTMVGVYCVAEIRAADGTVTRSVEVMSKEDVDKVRAKAAGGSGAWMEFYTEMAKKTVIRRASKSWPLNIELHEAIAADSEGEFDFSPKRKDAAATPEAVNDYLKAISMCADDATLNEVAAAIKAEPKLSPSQKNVLKEAGARRREELRLRPDPQENAEPERPLEEIDLPWEEDK